MEEESFLRKVIETILVLGVIPLVLLSSCALMVVEHSSDELQYYGWFFDQRAKQVGHFIEMGSYRVRFAVLGPKTPKNTAAACKWEHGVANILINRKKWMTLNTTEREIVVFHEMGHCILFRQHRDEKYLDRPASIMHSELIDYKVYKRNYWYYMKELFSPYHFCTPQSKEPCYRRYEDEGRGELQLGDHKAAEM